MICRENYHDTQEYLKYLIEVMQRDPVVVDQVYRFWIRTLLIWCDSTPFPQCSKVRPALPQFIARYSASTTKHICSLARNFFAWAILYYPERYKSIPPSWIDTLQPVRTVQKFTEHKFISLETMHTLISFTPPDFFTQRDQAACAFLFLSGMRAGAFVTMPIKAVDIANRLITQSPIIGMRTKLKKSAITRLLEVPELLEVVSAWDMFIRSQQSINALWYAGFQEINQGGRWRTKTLNANLAKLFRSVNLTPQSAHKFRHGHAVWALQHAQDIRDVKAISQNLMHSSITTTDSIYSILPADDVHNRIAHLK